MQQANLQMSSTDPTDFLVGGLGSLRQHCVVALKEFGVTAGPLPRASTGVAAR